MLSNQEVNGIVRAIISFTESDTKNKQEKQNEQSDSEQTSSITKVITNLQSLKDQILGNNGCKLVIQIPKLLQSLSALSRFKVGTHLREQTDMLRLQVRHQSRWCLWNIQDYGDEQVQQELVIKEYGRVISLSFCTSGGIGDEKDAEIRDGLKRISRFLERLRYGSNDDWYPSFQPLPLLIRMSLEQIEEEGANEELEASMNNNGMNGHIKGDANEAKVVTLNNFIHRH
ncbi:MAG: hypothetical protein EZS28_039887 [Streblomastix strix]|uniref:Uncharacterized protein n=1 Tax=Streblomastix strix TaxID=222440 RepID=A0A5J4U1J0_9EUKA|nr:MAG: hypothetical protein EZS28_039887 [Streblomastix strix]